MGDPPPEGAEERLGGPEEQLAISFLSSGAKRGSEYIFVGPPFSHPAFRRISALPRHLSSERAEPCRHRITPLPHRHAQSYILSPEMPSDAPSTC